jgi:hypothetical protein
MVAADVGAPATNTPNIAVEAVKITVQPNLRNISTPPQEEHCPGHQRDTSTRLYVLLELVGQSRLGRADRDKRLRRTPNVPSGALPTSDRPAGDGQ